MPSVQNKEALIQVKKILSENPEFVLSTYSGLNVAKMTELRARIRQKKARMKIIKNSLFLIALRESPVHSAYAQNAEDQLKGPIAVTFLKDDFSMVSKLLVDYSKEEKAVEVRAGFSEGKFLKQSEVKELAGLPSREELLSIIGRGLKTPAQKIAIGMNEVIAKLARAVKAVGEKNG